MTPTELDVPLSPSAEQIRRRMFASVRRGFDPDQVRDYLEQIAEQVEKLEKDLKGVRLQAETAKTEARNSASRSPQATEAQGSQDPYEDLSARMAGLLRSADEQAQRILRESKEESATVLAQARGEADRVRTDAQARAEQARAEGEQALRRAREEADRALSGLASRREVMIGQLQQMQSRLLDVARELETAIDRTDVTTELPEMPSISPSSAPTSATTASGSTGSAIQDAEPADPQAPPSPSASSSGNDPVDPRYEDLWSGGSAESVDLNLADLGDLDLNLGEESSGEGRRS
ncbi:MAG: DivIVA domain-containing protein [Actinomycetota bacterium]